MAITKTKKQEILKELADKIDNQKSIVFIDYTGTGVKDLSQLRNSLREKGNELKIAKKTLIGLAFKEKGLELDGESLDGQVAVVFGYEDEISPSKTVFDFGKEHESIKIIGGVLENTFYDAERTMQLAQLPSKNELLARLVGTLNAPVSNFVYVLSGVPKSFVQVLSQINK